MSSSKIMGYNLDDSVLDGVAMQSTSEEILAKMEQGVTAQCVKSVQYVESELKNVSGSGTSVLTRDITIPAVDLNKTILITQPCGEADECMSTYAKLTSSTNLHLEYISYTIATILMRVYVVEFY